MFQKVFRILLNCPNLIKKSDRISYFFFSFIHQLVYDASERLSGFEIAYHLLEETRICNASLHESNFHIFYNVLFGSPETLLKNICLDPSIHYEVSYIFVNKIVISSIKFSRCFQYLPDKDLLIKSTADTVFKNNFIIVDENMSALGFSTERKQTIYMVLSAIMNLGNIQFDTLADDSICIKIDSRQFLCNAAALLKLDEMQLEDVLISHTREVGNLQIK